MSVAALSKLPNQSPRPYIQPASRKAKAMTIAAAFQCVDGYVLCADTLMSHGTAGEVGSFASYKQKAFCTFEDDERKAAVCGAGDSFLLHSFAEKLFSDLRKKKNESVEDVIEQTLQDFANKIGTTPNLQLLIASMESGAGLFKTDGLLVTPAGPVEVFGLGENSLVQFLIDNLHNANSNGMAETVVLATFIAAAAKRYCPQYCGGKTDVITFSMWKNEPLLVEARIVEEIEQLFFEGGKQRFKDLMQTATKLVKSPFCF